MEEPKLLAYLEGFLSEARRARFEEVLEQRTRYLTVAMEDVTTAQYQCRTEELRSFWGTGSPSHRVWPSTAIVYLQSHIL